jgi:hypothetical protein
MTRTSRYLEGWLQDATSLAFFLPDGPYGRPFDNQYTFESLREDARAVTLFLSDEVVLRFTGHIRVSEEADKLSITDFDQLEFAIGETCKKVYKEGEVCLYRFL